MERTFSMIKPDAVQKGSIGGILQHIQEQGFRVVALKMTRMTKYQAENFYSIHRERPFFDSLTSYMSSGPVVAMVLERDHAIEHLRKTMGATDPAKAEPNTIRRLFGDNIEHNAIHGSDSLQSAQIEIPFFFSSWEILNIQG